MRTRRVPPTQMARENRITRPGRSKPGESNRAAPGYAPAVPRRFGWTLAGIVVAAVALRLFRLRHFSYGLHEVLPGFLIPRAPGFFCRALPFDAVPPPLRHLVPPLLQRLPPPHPPPQH